MIGFPGLCFSLSAASNRAIVIIVNQKDVDIWKTVVSLGGEFLPDPYARIFAL